MVQRDTSSNDNIEKLAREVQQLISEKEKKKDWKFNNCWFDEKKKKTIWFGPSDDPVISEALKLPFFTTAHALNHWSKDKMMAFIS